MLSLARASFSRRVVVRNSIFSVLFCCVFCYVFCSVLLTTFNKFQACVCVCVCGGFRGGEAPLCQPADGVRAWPLMARVWPSVVLIVACMILVWWGAHHTLGTPADTDTKVVLTGVDPGRRTTADSKPHAEAPQVSRTQSPPATTSPSITTSVSESDVSDASPSIGVKSTGCAVCRHPTTFAGSINATTRLQCQAFWHLRFPGEKDTVAMWYVIRRFFSIIVLVSSCIHVFLFSLLRSFVRLVQIIHSHAASLK